AMRPGRAVVGAVVEADLAQAAAVGMENEDVAVVVRVGVGSAIGNERDPLAVGTELRVAVVESSAGELAQVLAGAVDDPQVGVAVVEVALAVAAHDAAVDEDRRLGLQRLAAASGGGLARPRGRRRLGIAA